MWEALNNINTLLAIIGSCITISTAAIAIARRKTKTQGQTTQTQNTTTTGPAMSSTDILHGLDFWDKATVIGEGIVEGLFRGFIALGITFLILFASLASILILSALLHVNNMDETTAMQIFWVDTLIAGITGVIVGLMVGIVAGVNETKKCAERRRPANPTNPWSSSFGAWGKKNVEEKIPNAPLLKATGNTYVDRLYDAFHKQIEQHLNRYMGTLIIHAEDTMHGEVIHIVDQRSWTMFPDQRTTLSGTRQAYIKPQKIGNASIHAAVFKDLLADQGYVVWSDTKQPALVVVSPGEITAIDWR